MKGTYRGGVTKVDGRLPAVSIDLPTLAGHVLYERNMMLFCRMQVVRLSGTPEIEPLLNAVLEAFLIHCRNLQDFLAPRASAQKGDITVGLFLDKGLEYSVEPRPTKHRSLIDKHLSHLTAERAESTSPEWRVDELVREIEHAWVTSLRNSRRAILSASGGL